MACPYVRDIRRGIRCMSLIRIAISGRYNREPGGQHVWYRHSGTYDTLYSLCHDCGCRDRRCFVDTTKHAELEQKPARGLLHAMRDAKRGECLPLLPVRNRAA